MKKEDLCMLLVVVVLLLLLSRNTNVFEGFGAGDIPGSMDEMIDMMSEEEMIDTMQLPPTPPAPRPQATPPTPNPMMDNYPGKHTIPSNPNQPTHSSEPSPFGSPFSKDKKGAFGQGWVDGFDGDSDLFAPASGDLGEKIPVAMQQEYLTKKSLGTLTPQIMQNIDEKRTPGSVSGSDFQPFDPSSTSGSLLDVQFGGIQVAPQPGPPQPGPPQPGPPQPGPPHQGPPQPGPPHQGPPHQGPPQPGGDGVEVHMVYGSWCGHSKRAMPDFEELVSDTSVKTANGSPVKFVMTEDTSPGMEQFKAKVNGFPTYMVVKGNGEMIELEGHNRTKASITTAVSSMNV